MVEGAETVMHYFDKIMALVGEHPEITKPGSQSHVEVLHDDHCGVLAGTGDCTCDPDIKLVTVENATSKRVNKKRDVADIKHNQKRKRRRKK